MLKVQLSSMQKKLKKTTETGTGEQLMNKTQAVMSNFISIILHKIGIPSYFS
jgi:predicted metalloenzyme YecM